MTPLLARRLSQAFFLLLFLWLGFVLNEGHNWWQLSGWPVNLFLNLDPLAMLGVWSSSLVIHGAMLLALITLLSAFLWGRAFCGFVCPLGAINHFISWLGLRKKSPGRQLELNRYHPAQKIKYYVLALFIAAALAGQYLIFLDPIPLLQRGYTLAFQPLANAARHYQEAAPLAITLLLILLANLWRPRFFCRYLCPLGALLGIIGRLAFWRPALIEDACVSCRQCQSQCQGAANPQADLASGECLTCLNCLSACPSNALTYSSRAGAPAQAINPSRRLALSALAVGFVGVAGAMAKPAAALLRPPGALHEADFLARCLRCGQCIAICPGNVLQPMSLLHGVENYLTPTLNFNAGACRLNCNLCGQVCPSAAISPFSLAMRLGQEGQESLRLGLASVDKNLCLPWAYGRPCLVCEENCPVSPKAITVTDAYLPLTDWLAVAAVEPDGALIMSANLPTSLPRDVRARLRHEGDNWRTVAGAADSRLSLAAAPPGNLQPGQELRLYQHVQRPSVNPRLCVGCGVCQNLCPLQESKGIRVVPENKSNSSLFIG